MKRTDKAGEELPLPELLEAFRKANAAQADTFFAMDKKAQITKAGRKNKTHGNEDY